MAVKTDVLLLAESGDVTVARRTAFYTYGKFDVILPEGQEQEETDSRLTDGYLARAHDGNVGRFDFGFARADATVNIDAGTSDLETQIDSAELRSEGDVFFEGDIGPEGFNGFVPGVDFDTGDIVSVTRWGSRLSLPVTDIEYEVSDSGGPRASRVHVSGQLIHDAASRRRSNDEIRQQIAAEKRERLRQVGAVDQKATQAKDTAVQAKDTAGQAKQVAQNANSAASEAQRSADGKSTIFYGATTPTGAKAGDTWFKDVAGGGTVLMQFVNGEWVEKVNTKAIDDELAANQAALAENADALAELSNVTLPALRQELEDLDGVTATEVANKLATLETKLADADKKLKQDLQGELAALDEVLSGDLTSGLASLKEDLEAADAAAAQAVATTLVQLENRLKAADQALKTDLVEQLGDLEADLAALDTAVGENLTSKLAALRTELIQADATVRTTLRGELSTLKTQLQNADATLKTDLVAQLNAARKALEDADDAVTNDLSKRLEDTRKDLKAASDTIAEDLAGVDMLVENQRPGNLFPDPFFKHSLWGSRYITSEECLEINADGTTNGIYYFPNGYDVYQGLMTLEPGASYLLTMDVRFGGNEVIEFLHIYSRYRDMDGNRKSPLVGRINRVSSINYKWGTTSLVLTMPDDVASEVTIGFYASSAHASGNVRLRNVRLHRAADNSLIIDGAVTAAKVKAGVIDADHIAAGAIVATKLAADSVVAGKIATNAVVAKNIKAGEITTAKLAAEAVTANEIASDTILAKNIKSGQITTAKLAADAVTANEIAANAVTANAIKAGEVTTKKLAANAVTANEIASDTILAKNIKSGQITTEKLAADAVTANKLAADSVLAKNIKAGEITTAKLGAKQITTEKLAAGAVTANELQAENATIDKLWANGIAAKSVVTNRVLVAGNGNMLPEIATYATSTRPEVDPFPRPFGINTAHPSVWIKDRAAAVIQHPLNLVAGQKYRLSYRASASVNGTKHYWQLINGTADGSSSGGVSVKVRGGNSSYVILNETVNTSVASYSAEFEAITTGTHYLQVYPNHTNGADNESGYQWFRDLRLEKMTGATLIEDGAVTTNKIAADAVTAESIKADQVLAKHVKSDQILAKHVKSGEIKAEHLLAEEATIDKLWANGLVAKTVQTASLSVGSANLYRDPALLDANSFDNRRSDTGGYGGGGSFTVAPSTATVGAYDTLSASRGRPTRLVPGVTYYISAMARPDRLVTSDKIRLYLRAYPTADATGDVTWASPQWVSNSVSLAGGNWHRIEGTFKMHSEYEYLVLGFYVASGSQAQVIFSDPMVIRQHSATMIADGAITTGKVAADAITANKIATDAVTAKQIKAGQITSDHISSAKISSDKITVKNGFIQNAMIGDGQVNNAKIANLDASKITAGTINANRIGAKTIQGKHLAVDTIEANQIKANVFTQVANSVLPLIPGTVTPTWTDGLYQVTRTSSNGAGLPEGISTFYRHPIGRITAGDSQTVYNTYNNVVSIDPNLEYEASWWVKSSAGTARYIYVTLEDQNGATDIVQKVEGVDDDGNAYSQYTWGNPIRAIITPANTTWTRYTTLFTFKEGTKSVRINNIQFNNSNNSSDSYLYIAGLEISPHIIPQRDVDARQDQSINKMEEYVRQLTEIFYSQSAAYAQKFNELSEPMSGGLIAGEDETGVMTTTTSSITCSPGWVGHILVHYVHPSGGGIDTPGLSVTRHEVTGSNRTFSIPSGRTSRSGSAAIHWFKRPGRAYVTDMSTGAQSATYDTWKTLSTTSVGTGQWNLTATVGWDAATNHNKYGIRILVNGSVVAQVAPRTGLGPLLPIGDGYRTQSVSASGNGNGRTTKFEIQAYTDATTSASGPRRIRRVNATLDWTQIS